MRILGIDERPIEELRFLNASRRGRAEVERLPVLRARVDGLPEELDAIVATSDLQGVAPVRSAFGANRLLGEALAERLVDLAEADVLPPPDRVGVLLAGDLFSDADARRRGATGDVTDVWVAFAEAFRWVIGVAGNHDELDERRLRRLHNVELLDGHVSTIDGLTLGGVGGIIGSSDRPRRRDEEAFLGLLTDVLAKEPDVVVLHQGPEGTAPEQRGHPSIASWIAERPALVVCGHSHWDEPLAHHGAAQVLNVDARVVLLER